PANYNAAWWELRERYQGVRAPVARTEEHFDPGAKYHVPANVPYTRYFLAHLLQFQFHRALCAAAGYEGPLNRCTICGSEAAASSWSCWRLARAGAGRTHSRRSRAGARWTPQRSSSTARRSRRGSTSRTAAGRAGGEALRGWRHGDFSHGGTEYTEFCVLCG